MELSTAESPNAIDVSVIIPTYNRGDALAETLRALAHNQYPETRWEAIILDDGSSEDISTFVGQIAGETGKTLKYFRQKNAGPAAARNRGAMAASGHLLIFIDNDILVNTEFIQKHVDALTNNPGCWIIGRVINPVQLRQTPFGRYRNAVHESYHGQFPEMRLYPTEAVTTQNLSLRAEEFRHLGGFDEAYTIASSEDWELGFRARQKGIRLLYNPEIVVLHNDWAVSLDKYCERQWLYSISDVLLWQKYGEMSLRARLVKENAPIDWGGDGLLLAMKKAIKRMLATRPGRDVVRWACWWSERLVPDSRWNWRAYDLSVAIAIFRGVREGLRRYHGV
jgi:GT2 family glycosyltransferase